MSTRIVINTLQQIITTADKLGGKLPKAFTTKAAELVALEGKTRTYARNANHVNVPDAILDALAAGSDPYDDQVVHEALMQAEVASLTNQVTGRLYVRVESFLAEHASDILAGLKPCVDKAGATLQKAADKFGDLELEETKGVLSRGGDAAQLWADAKRAEGDIQRVLSIRDLLTSVGGSGVRNPGQYRALTLADVPAEEFVSKLLGHSMPSGWTIARNGWPFSLATPDELAARIARVQGETSQRDQKAANAFRDEYRRTHAAVVLT